MLLLSPFYLCFWIFSSSLIFSNAFEFPKTNSVEFRPLSLRLRPSTWNSRNVLTSSTTADVPDTPTRRNQQQQLQNNKQQRTQKSMQMEPANALAGVVLLLFLLLSLTLNADDVVKATVTSGSSIEGQTTMYCGVDAATAAEEAELLVVAAQRVIDANVPTTAASAITSVVANGVAGVIGSFAGFFITATTTAAMQWQRQISVRNNYNYRSDNDDERAFLFSSSSSSTKSSSRSSSSSSASQQEEPRISDVIADGDYFIARAAALPIIEGLGLPPSVAIVAAVVLASVPSQLIKIQSKIRVKRLIQEDEMLQYLLQEQQQQQKKKTLIADRLFRLQNNKNFVDPSSASSSNNNNNNALKPPLKMVSVPIASLQPVFSKKDRSEVAAQHKEEKNKTLDDVDLVEIFTDTARWLEYDVLRADFGGATGSAATTTTASFDVGGALQSAEFGVIASLSSQVYADTLYYYFGLGGERKRDEIQQRTCLTWFMLYARRLISAVVLFGVYDLMQKPISNGVSGVLSGGVGSCWGSSQFNMCVNSFVEGNPISPSREAQVRALITSLASLWHQFDTMLDMSGNT